jgi:hypothetical protein
VVSLSAFSRTGTKRDKGTSRISLLFQLEDAPLDKPFLRNGNHPVVEFNSAKFKRAKRAIVNSNPSNHRSGSERPGGEHTYA